MHIAELHYRTPEGTDDQFFFVDHNGQHKGLVMRDAFQQSQAKGTSEH
jgi:hypothetical protein